MTTTLDARYRKSCSMRSIRMYSWMRIRATPGRAGAFGGLHGVGGVHRGSLHPPAARKLGRDQQRGEPELLIPDHSATIHPPVPPRLDGYRRKAFEGPYGPNCPKFRSVHPPGTFKAAKMLTRSWSLAETFHLIRIMMDDYFLYLVELLHIDDRARELMRNITLDVPPEYADSTDYESIKLT